MTLEIKINCAECVKGNHDSCTKKDTCLCANDNHGKKDPTKIQMFGTDWRYHVYPSEEPRVYEQARHDEERLEDLFDNGLRNGHPTTTLVEMIKLLIYTKHVISKFQIIKELHNWCINNRVNLAEIDDAIEIAFSDNETFGSIKQICNNLGRQGKDTTFDRTQLIETAEWVKGRYFVKRVELTGDILYFNGKYYENDAEAIIRRAARHCIIKSKNSDINEIVKYVEDTCHIITWKDIESSIHVKCLLNGLYNIKTGIFSKKFNPDHIILNQIPHNYDESKSFCSIEEKITTLIPNDSHRQSYYDFLSSCMHPYTGVDYQFGMVGPTGTGKSQLGILAELIIGEQNVGDATIHLIAKDQTTQKNMAFNMINIDYELSDESIKQIDVIKKWITQDKFTARGIYEQATTFRPMSRLMFMANDLYEIANEDHAEAIYDRTYIIRVDKKFRHQKDEIKNVMRKTATDEELDGILTFLLKNATWIYNNETYHHKISLVDVENIWNAYGNRIKMFYQKWIEKGSTHKTEASEPYNKWMSHCIQNGFKPKDKKQFYGIFDEIAGVTPTKTRIDDEQCRAYIGFRIKSDEEIAKSQIIPFTTEKSSKSSKNLIPQIIFHSTQNYFQKKNMELLELLTKKEEN